LQTCRVIVNVPPPPLAKLVENVELLPLDGDPPGATHE